MATVTGAAIPGTAATGTGTATPGTTAMGTGTAIPGTMAMGTGTAIPGTMAKEMEMFAKRMALTLCVEIGRAHVLTPVTNAHIVCRLLRENKKQHTRHRRAENPVTKVN